MIERAQALMRQLPFPGYPSGVMPGYAGVSIVNLMQSLLAHFGLPCTTPLAFHDEFARALDGKRKIIFLVVDGLGWYNLASAREQHAELDRLCAQALCWPLTSVFPSTTSAAITSLVAGLTPAQHGVIGYMMYFPEYRQVANMLTLHTPDTSRKSLQSFGFIPADYVQHPSVLQQMRAGGILAGAYTYGGYVDSGLSQLVYHDAMPSPYFSLGDLFMLARQTARAPVPQFLFLYWSNLDTLAHNYGARSEAYGNELAMLGYVLAEQVMPALDDDTALLLIADHGHIDGNDDEAINLMRFPELLSSLRVPPAGEGRSTHFFLTPGSASRVSRVLRDIGDLTLFTRDEFIDQHLLGFEELRPGLYDRVGDLIVIPHGSRRTMFEYQPRPHTVMVGRHGGPSPEEMLVPLLMWA